MTQIREDLLTEIIYKFGFENENTIRFAELCEYQSLTDEQLKRIAKDYLSFE